MAALHKDIFAEAERLDVLDKAPFVLTEVLLGEGILRELTTYRNIFLRVSFLLENIFIYDHVSF